MSIEQATRRRASAVLFGTVAVGTTAFVASITVAPLVGEDLSRSAALSGLPWAAGVLGTGVGSAVLSQLMARRGRGQGLLLGYLAGGCGALIAILAMVGGRFEVFVLAIFLMGAANSANHLSRYAAADLYPSERRGAAVGNVVWAGTIGGVVGPALLAPSDRAAVDAGLPQLGGPFVVALFGCFLAVIALVVFLRWSPLGLRAHDHAVETSGRRIWDMWRDPRAQTALLALAVAQTVMVMIMAMTPVHLRSMGHGLGATGLVISIHVFGMYGLSPLSGRLADRFGRVPVILAGFATLILAAFTAAAAPHDAGSWLAIPLFLLGWGWSLVFVAGSALLTEGLSFADRARLQGGTDTVVWTSAAIAGLGSGLLVGSFGYALLCIIGAGLVVAPIVAVVTSSRSPVRAS